MAIFFSFCRSTFHVRSRSASLKMCVEKPKLHFVCALQLLLILIVQKYEQRRRRRCCQEAAECSCSSQSIVSRCSRKSAES